MIGIPLSLAQICQQFLKFNIDQMKNMTVQNIAATSSGQSTFPPIYAL